MPNVLSQESQQPSTSLSPDTSNVNYENSAQEILWCYCREPESGKLIMCEKSGCKIEWFQFKCLKMSNAPKNKWICPDCRKETYHLKTEKENE